MISVKGLAMQNVFFQWHQFEFIYEDTWGKDSPLPETHPQRDRLI
jgi:hypothetical protein